MRATNGIDFAKNISPTNNCSTNEFLASACSASECSAMGRLAIDRSDNTSMNISTKIAKSIDQTIAIRIRKTDQTMAYLPTVGTPSFGKSPCDEPTFFNERTD